MPAEDKLMQVLPTPAPTSISRGQQTILNALMATQDLLSNSRLLPAPTSGMSSSAGHRINTRFVHQMSTPSPTVHLVASPQVESSYQPVARISWKRKHSKIQIQKRQKVVKAFGGVHPKQNQQNNRTRTRTRMASSRAALVQKHTERLAFPDKQRGLFSYFACAPKAPSTY